MKKQQLRQPSRQNYSDTRLDEERPSVIAPYERETQGSTASIPQLGSISLRSSRSSTRDLPPLEAEPERTELTFAVPEKDMNELGDISHDALKRAFRQLNIVRRHNNTPPLELPAASINKMTSYEVHSFLIPYVDFVDYTCKSVGPLKDRKELENGSMLFPMSMGILERMLLIARHWMAR